MALQYLAGERVALCPLQRDHLPKVFEWYNNVAIERFLLTSRIPVSMDHLQNWYSDLARDGSVAYFAIHLLDTKEHVGNIWLRGIDWGKRSAQVGVLCDPRYWGRGYATESVRVLLGYAFGLLSLHRVEAQTLAYNRAMIRVLEKCGFQREGTLREAIFVGGQWHDLLIYGILAPEVGVPGAQ